MGYLRNHTEQVFSGVSSPLTRDRSATYSEWPDVAMGVGIILVVFGHAWRGLNTAGILPGGPVFGAVDKAIYAFHMPLFFFLSGWFFPRALQLRPEGTLLRRVGQRILYPMCIWTYLFIAFQLLAGGDANIRVAPSDLLRLPIPPYLHLWFLWALALIQIVTILLRPVAQRHMTLFFAGMTGFSVVLLLSNIIPFTPYLTGVLPSAPYFFLGALWGLLGPIPRSGQAVIIAVLAFVFVEGLVISGIPKTPLATLLIAVVALVSVLIVLRGMMPFGGPAFGLLATLGGYSMAIYLMHTLFSSATRIVLIDGFGTRDLPLHLAAGVAAGLFVPLIIYNKHIPGILRLALLGQDQRRRAR